MSSRADTRHPFVLAEVAGRAAAELVRAAGGVAEVAVRPVAVVARPPDVAWGGKAGGGKPGGALVVGPRGGEPVVAGRIR
jgi:hypothetical protein